MAQDPLLVQMASKEMQNLVMAQLDGEEKQVDWVRLVLEEMEATRVTMVLFGLMDLQDA